MQFFDTHCHLDDEQFAADRPGVVRRAQAAGVTTVIAVGVTAASSSACIELATRHEGVAAAVGIQPNYCGEAKPSDWDEVTDLAQRSEVVAIGETGLDRYWDYTPFDVQQEFFQRHLNLSQQCALPFVVHMRDCQADILAMLRDARRQGPLHGVMHSFTGSDDGARECLELGLHISFAGMVTYKKSTELREIAGHVPDDRLLIETDAPYLSPHPKRSQRPNEPSLLVHTAECLADVRGVPLEQFAQQTTQNAKLLFARG